MAKGLTQRQRRVLDFIASFVSEHGFPPTYREIAAHLGIRSTNGVNDHLRALERKGYVSRQNQSARTLRVLRTSDGRPFQAAGPETAPGEEAGIPVLGQVAAGALSEAVEHAEEHLPLDPSLFGAEEGRLFALRIRGESMIEAGIHDGDVVFVDRSVPPRRGDIVVAMVGDEATCKYYFPEGGHVRLEPANREMAPILVPGPSLQVAGVVTGVLRRYPRGPRGPLVA